MRTNCDLQAFLMHWHHDYSFLRRPALFPAAGRWAAVVYRLRRALNQSWTSQSMS